MATSAIYTLSLHDALPIFVQSRLLAPEGRRETIVAPSTTTTNSPRPSDRKSTRLNSSHANISYAVFCLKKKNRPRMDTRAAAREVIATCPKYVREIKANGR